MKKYLIFSACFLVLALNLNVKAQGCSDAGFCSLSAMRDYYNDSIVQSKKFQIAAAASMGKSDFDISVVNTQLDFSAKLGSQLTLGLKAVYTSISGELAKVSGLSDVFITAKVKLPKDFSFTAGLKLPLSNGNNQTNGMPLPMFYQTSLGTVDLVLGVNKQLNNWLFSIGAQVPVTQNKNAFIRENFSSNTLALKYTSTNSFERMSDLLLRASYNWKVFDSKLELIPGLLPVYHLLNDSYIDASGFQQSINGSAGLTLNTTLGIKYNLSNLSVLELNAGAPVVARKARPDGLTRKFVISLEYKLRF